MIAAVQSFDNMQARIDAIDRHEACIDQETTSPITPDGLTAPAITTTAEDGQPAQLPPNFDEMITINIAPDGPTAPAATVTPTNLQHWPAQQLTPTNLQDWPFVTN